ncbi:MAG TPA: tRNA (guanosine(37)-N1)-methyltransferase TrmD [Dehalococcoidia bacterium]|nr:tRNA (guanosine(37)-N1)-methyltransferase TrmD [Dehalococcoidia bacterium]
MRIDVLTLFPEMFSGPLQASILGRAIESGIVEVVLHNIRDYAEDKHHVVDDYVFGGGPGMVMKPEPLFAAVEVVSGLDAAKGHVVLLTPQGRLLTQQIGEELSRRERLILVCGHYEGVDERVREHLVDDEISIGDYVLSGGELPAMVLIDVIVRRLPGVLGSDESLAEESHAEGLLEYPQYTRPAEFRGWEVPEVLLSGHHAQIAAWRRQQSMLRTARRRPDLLDKIEMTEAERRLVDEALAAKD